MEENQRKKKASQDTKTYFGVLFILIDIIMLQYVGAEQSRGGRARNPNE